MTAPPLHIGPLLVDPPLLQAPMAGFTNYAFRQIDPPIRRRRAAGHRDGQRPRLFAHRRPRRPFPDRLWGVNEEPRPLAVQIWDNDPETLAAVGQRLADEFRVERGRHQLRLPGAATFPKRPTAARICCAIPIASARSSTGWPRPAARAGDGEDSPGLHAATRSTPSKSPRRSKRPGARR